MNNPTSALLIFLIIGVSGLSAQVTSIKKLEFPYKNGYEFTMTDTTIEYDQYNFPTGQKTQNIKYTVKDNPEKEGVLSFFLAIFDNESGKFLDARPSYLTLDSKGMSWWTEKSEQEKGKKTQAIKLPLKVGTSWKSSFGGYASTMTCIATDTILNTIYGPISCFGVSYEAVAQENSELKIHLKVKEFYNIYAGKVHTEDVTYLLVKSTNKERIIAKGWGNITYSNLTEDQKKLIK